MQLSQLGIVMNNLIGNIIAIAIFIFALLISIFSFKLSAFLFLSVSYLPIAYLYLLHHSSFSEHINESKKFNSFEKTLIKYLYVYVEYPGASKLIASALSTTSYFSLALGAYGVLKGSYVLSFFLIIFPLLAKNIVKKLNPLSHINSIVIKDIGSFNSQQIESILKKFNADNTETLFSEYQDSHYFLGGKGKKGNNYQNLDRDWSKEIKRIIEESHDEIFKSDSSEPNSPSKDGNTINFSDLLAKAKTPEEQYEIGNMYLNGNLYNKDYPERDYIKALNWYEKSASQGNAKAQFQLGWMLLRSKGSYDPVLSNAYFRISFNCGHKDAEDWFNDIERLSPEEIGEAKYLASSWTIGQTLRRAPK